MRFGVKHQRDEAAVELLKHAPHVGRFQGGETLVVLDGIAVLDGLLLARLKLPLPCNECLARIKLELLLDASEALATKQGRV
jgi:hypothetical protein